MQLELEKKKCLAEKAESMEEHSFSDSHEEIPAGRSLGGII